MKFTLETIPQAEQRYPTAGDYWQEEDGTWHITASELPNPDHSFLILIHELIETYATQRKGIPEPEIMAFDLQFEKERKEGKHTEEDEPGNDPRAPYYREHQISSAIEYLAAVCIDVPWHEYDQAVLALLKDT